MTDPADAADDDSEQLAQVDRAADATSRLIALVGELTGDEQSPPLGAIRPDQWSGRTAEAYREKHEKVTDAATRLRELSQAQLDRLLLARGELSQRMPPSTEPKTHG